MKKSQTRTMTATALKEWRLGLGMTQSQLADHLGTSQQMCGHLETGWKHATERTIKQLIALSKSWGVEPPRTHPRVVNIAAPVVAKAAPVVPVVPVPPVNDGFGG
jgi:predicted transcriptional regulator